jgi:hypothetical protein
MSLQVIAKVLSAAIFSAIDGCIVLFRAGHGLIQNALKVSPPLPCPKPLFIFLQGQLQLKRCDYWFVKVFAVHQRAFPTADDYPSAYLTKICNFGSI